MAKFNPQKLTSTERKELLNDFFNAIGVLKTKQDIVNFFRDLLSESEAVMLARRLQIAKMILAGAGYFEIREKLGVGFDNIKSVKHWLEFGFKGYERVIKEMSKRISS